MSSSTDYVKTIMNYGLVGSNNGLSVAGKILRTTASIEIDKARNQLKALKKDTSRSHREKAELAAIGSQKLTKELDKQLNTAISSIKLSREKETIAIKKAFVSDWDQSASAIFAIELSKDPAKKLASLTDKNALAALSSAPQSITGMKPETLADARNAYIRKNHPEIVELQEATDADVRLAESLASINDGFNSEYNNYVDHPSLRAGLDSEYK